MSALFEAWDLFGTAWCTMLLAAVALAWPGILVVARGQIMLAVAAAQAAACGAAAGMYLMGVFGGGHVHGDIRIHMAALAGGLLGTAFAWRSPIEHAGWLFAAGSAGTVLFVANSAYGMHDILALQHSNALSAGSFELWAFACAVLVLAVVVALRHRELRLLAVDPDAARGCGLAVRRWNFAIALSLGLLISLSVSSLGLLYTFACLVLPTLIANRLSPSLWLLLVLAPALAFGGALSGIVVGHQWDLPPGQTTTAILVLALPLVAVVSGLVRAVRPNPNPVQ